MPDQKFLCPVCAGELAWAPGSVARRDGVTMFCPHLDCPAQEVTGFGTNPAAAFKIIREKFSRK